MSPLPHGVDLRGVWALATDDVWAVGAGAMLVHWDGAAWARVPLDLDPVLDLNDIWAASPEHLFVSADDGSILSFDPRATPIAIEQHQPLDPMTTLWGSSAKDVWAVSPSVGVSMVVHFDGSRWTSINPSPLESASMVCGSGLNDVFVLGDAGQLARFDGESWHKLQSPTIEWQFVDAWVDAQGLLAVAGSDQLIEYASETWKVSESTQGLPTDIAGEGVGLTAVTRFADGEIWAGSDGGSLLVRKGERWSAPVLREGHRISEVATAGEHVFAVGEAGTALVVPRGEAWTQPVGTRRHEALAIAGLGEHVWAADEFNLWQFDGERWTPHELMAMTRALWPVSPTEVHLIGELGYRRFDGQTMHRAELPLQQFHGEDVWASGSDDVWLAAREHLMHFDGQRWQTEEIGVEAWDMHGSGEDNLLLAGPNEAGVWSVARRSRGEWKIELELKYEALFVHAQGSEGGVVLDERGSAWVRHANGWTKIESMPAGDGYSILGVWMHDPTHIWAIEEDGSITRYDGAKWQIERSDMQAPRAIGGSERYLLLADTHGSVVRRWLSN